MTIPINKELASLLAKAFDALIGELVDDSPVISQELSSLICKEAEYITKKACTASSIAGLIAIRHEAASVPAVNHRSADLDRHSPLPYLAKHKVAKNGPQTVRKHFLARKKKRLLPSLTNEVTSPEPKMKKKDFRFRIWTRKSLHPKISLTQHHETVEATAGCSPTAEMPNSCVQAASGATAVLNAGILMDSQLLTRELEKIPYFRDPAFKTLFHMERSTFQALCEVVGLKVAGRTVSPYSKLLGVLWWLAGRESMKQIVKRFECSIGTFHNAVHLFSTAIVEHVMPQTIRWPSLEEDVEKCLSSFEKSYNFQGVMGCLGACRLPLRLRSASRGAPYCDPNGHPSILLQVVCDADCRLLHVSAGWPGTTSEFAAFQESDLPGLLDKLPNYAQVLASKDYPARNHVWVPFSQAPLSAEMLYFNHLHTTGMGSLSRTTALLKNTFQRLELLEMMPEKIPSVVLAACALINFILEREEVAVEDRFSVLSGSGFDGVPSRGASSRKQKKTVSS